MGKIKIDRKKKGMNQMVKKATTTTSPYQEVVKQLVNQDGILALFIEDQYLSEDERVLALEAIRYRLAQAVHQDGALLGVFKPKYQTYEICWHAVTNNGLALQSVREDLMTMELCLEAIKQNTQAFLYVPDPFQTHEMCLQVIQSDVNFIRQIRPDLLTFEFCLEAMQHNPSLLSYLKEHFELPNITLEVKTTEPVVETSMESTEGRVDTPENVYPIETNQEAI